MSWALSPSLVPSPAPLSTLAGSTKLLDSLGPLPLLLLYFHLPGWALLILVAWVTAPLLQDSDQSCFFEKTFIELLCQKLAGPS